MYDCNGTVSKEALKDICNLQVQRLFCYGLLQVRMIGTDFKKQIKMD